MNKTLNNVQPGETVRIVRISVGGQLRRRLVEMGVLPGVIVEVVRIAPLGDPMEIRIRGTSLSLRKCEAANIGVVAVEGPPGASRGHRHRHGKSKTP